MERIRLSVSAATVALVLALNLAAAAAADEPCPCPPADEAPKPLWTLKIGLSYVATTGNSESQTLGADVTAERRPDPWGVDLFATYDRAEESQAVAGERTYAGARARRALDDRWELFGEATGERDRFAGIDLRTVLATGTTYHALTGPRHQLDLDAGLSWTDEDLLAPADDTSYAGGLAGFAYTWAISERASFGQHLAWYPNFETSGDWRLESATTLEAALSQRLALRLGYEVRYRNEPVGNRDDSDTTTRMSLVVNL